MAVKLELYRVFQEVARMGNISAAAQNLYISQSAVSQSIKQLEEQLQVRLFSRSTRGVVLTSEGKMLLDYVSHGLGLIQCGEEKLAQSRQLLTGELIIGASDTVTKTYLVSRLEAFHQNYPAIQIRILNGTSQMVLDYLHAGQVDIAFASEPKDKDAYSIRHCFDTHQIFVAAPNYDCDFDHAHTLEEIAAFPLILLERKASSRAYVEQYFQQHGVSLKPAALGLHVHAARRLADLRGQPLYGFHLRKRQNDLRYRPFLPLYQRLTNESPPASPRRRAVCILRNAQTIRKKARTIWRIHD